MNLHRKFTWGGSRTVENSLFNMLAWTFLFSMVFILSLTKTSVLPAKFFYDAVVIDEMSKYVGAFSFGSSYTNTAYFYRSIGFDLQSNWFVAAASIVCVGILAAGVRHSRAVASSPSHFLVVSFLSVLSAVYIPYLSKEFIAATPTAFFFALLPFGFKKAAATFIALVVIYGLVFRTYWLIFAILLSTLLFSYKCRNSFAIASLVAILCLFVIVVALELIIGIDVNALRNDVNEYRLSSSPDDARTMITPIVSGGGVLSSYFSFLVILLFLVFPVPLFLLLSPYHSFLAVLISFISYLFIVNIRRYSRRPASTRDPLFEFCTLTILSFLTVQCIFEPDYGSFLRHLSPFFPLLMVSLFRAIPGAPSSTPRTNQSHD